MSERQGIHPGARPPGWAAWRGDTTGVRAVWGYADVKERLASFVRPGCLGVLVRGGGARGARGSLGAAVAEFGELELDVGLGAEPLDGEEEAGVGAAHLVEGQ